MEKYYDESIALCSSALPAELVKKNKFRPDFGFYYYDYFKDVAPIDQKKRVPADITIYDDNEARATLDMQNIIASYFINKNDTIFLPHADFYGTIGLINALHNIDAEARPSVVLRFIGVMENASQLYRSPFQELMARVRSAIRAGIRMRFSAETPKYADHLAPLLGTEVSVTAYPEMGEILPYDLDSPFTFYCAGSARHDKGFNRLANIFESVRSQDPECQIRFITQLLPGKDAVSHIDQCRSVYSIPGVEVQPTAISPELLRRTFARSHAVLLPYDTEVYKLRGSAVLMEAIYYGRPAITFAGSAFSNIIEYYSAGYVVKDENEMIDAIIKLASEKRDKLIIKAMQSRFRFNFDNNASFSELMK
ncbi:hypothetical protein OB03_06825 [Brevundimonas sp. GN22]